MIINKEVVGIIPARGGSKGLPRKNVLPLAGKPLIAWSIEAARAAKQVSRVIVSTDDEEIARVTEAFGGEVIWRPKGLSGDSASSETALLHVLEQLEQHGCVFDTTVFLQATSPLRTSADIDDAVLRLDEGGYDSLFSSVEMEDLCLWHSVNGVLAPANYDPAGRVPRQFRDKELIENGSIYVFQTNGFRKEHCRFFGRIGHSVMESWKLFEIDTLSDFDLCEKLMKTFLV